MLPAGVDSPFPLAARRVMKLAGRSSFFATSTIQCESESSHEQADGSCGTALA